MNSTYIDASMVRRALETIHQDGEVFEIRIIQENKALSGYFKSIDKAVEVLSHVSPYDLRGANVYTLLNPLLDACYSRAQSDKIIKAKTATKDSEVTRLRWLFIDLDPVRITGISSSNEELAKARERTVNVYRYLKREGFSEPLIGMSGNGYHLLYRVDLPTTEADTVKTFLEAMGMLFTDDIIKIDAVNFNPSRPCKLYGTLAQKGTGTEERPHRMAHIVQTPETFEPVELEKIQKIAALLPPKVEKKKGNRNTYTGQKFDIVEWMNRYGIEYREKAGDGYTKYILNECPFDSNHKNPDAMITQGDGGEIGFSCFHDSCKDKKWRDVRLKYEPDAYDRKEDYEDDGRIDAGWNEHKKMMAQSRAQNINKENTEKEEQTQTQIEEEDIPLTGPVTPQRTFRKLKSASDLLKKELPKTKAFWGVGDKAPLLKEGTCILSAKPKLGKSWLAMGLCLSAVNGMDFMGRKMEQCSALYLDLESSEELQQERLKDMLEATPEYGQGLDRFYLETTTDRIGMGLEEQIENYMEQDPSIGIVVIDVFQGIRTAAINFKESEYDHAYRDIKPLNKLSEKYHISIILVYHNRKSVDPDDPFSNILGSVGSQAAVAQMIVMYRQRENDPIHIAINGRSIRGRQDLDAEFKDGAWASVDAGNTADREKARLLQEYMESPIRKGVLALMRKNSMWKGRCSSIIGDAVQLGVPITDTAKSVGGFLHRHQGRLLEMDGIKLQIIQSGTASKTYKFTIADQDPEPDEDSLQAPFIDMGYGEI